MKNIIIFYTIILIPIPIMFYLAKNNHLNSFFLMLIIYILIYRPLTDGIRLYSKGIIKKSEIWKLLIPFFRWKLIKKIYTNN